MKENLCVRFTPPKLMPLVGVYLGGRGHKRRGWVAMESRNGMESEAAEVV